MRLLEADLMPDVVLSVLQLLTHLTLNTTLLG